MWLVYDLKRLYYQTKASRIHPGLQGWQQRPETWFLELVNGPGPAVARPPKMYTTDLEEEFWVPEPRRLYVENGDEPGEWVDLG